MIAYILCKVLEHIFKDCSFQMIVRVRRDESGSNEVLQISLHKQGDRFVKAWQQKGYKMICVNFVLIIMGATC